MKTDETHMLDHSTIATGSGAAIIQLRNVFVEHIDNFNQELTYLVVGKPIFSM